MMTNTMTSLPAMAGATLLSALARSIAWMIRKYAAAPLTTTAFLALTLGLGMAANNALFAQVEHHPAPFFFETQSPVVAATPSADIVPPLTIAPPPERAAPRAAVEPAIAPVVSAPPAAPVAETVAATVGDEVSNAELAEAQRKLQSMGLFDGDIDGFYGPKTAESIRAFEMRNGLTPKGDMSRPVIEAILRANASDSASINQARTNAQTTAAPQTATVASTPDANAGTEEIVAGQRALQALISPQAEIVAPTPTPTETFVAPAASVAAPVAQPAQSTEAASTSNPSADTALIETIQTGLSSLGFLHSRIDGVAGEETAKAIRNFEVFNNYEVTGRVSPELVDLLVAAGADI